jgi:hypothetical protein
MKLKIYFIAIFMIAVYGCGERTGNKGNMGKVIHVNPYDAEEYVNLSEIADSIICIKLQPNPGDVMGRIMNITVRRKYIYAQDVSQDMIFIFDKTGKFVSKLDKKGQGPDEYNSIGPFFIDDSEEYIEVIDMFKQSKFKYINISFESVEVLPIPDISYSLCRKSDGFYYFATLQGDNVINDKKTNAGLVILDDKNNMKTLFDKNIETNNSYYFLCGECFTQNDKNELFFSNMFDNTFYRLETGEAYPVFTVDFGKYGMDNRIGLRSTEEQMSYINDMHDLAFFPILNINNSDIMSFSYYFKQESGRIIPKEEDIRQYIKIKDRVYHVKKIRNDLTDFPDRLYTCSYLYDLFYGCPHEAWFEDYLVDVVVTNTYFSNDEKMSNGEKLYVEGLGEITSDEEIIVVLMKLKK